MLPQDFKDTETFLSEDYATVAPLIIEEIQSGCFSVEQVNQLLADGYLTEYSEMLISNGFATQGAKQTTAETAQNDNTDTQSSSSDSEQEKDVLYEQFKTMYASTQCNMRSQSSQDSERIAVIACGDAVEVIGECGKWYMIKYQNQTGYVYAKYLSNEEPKTVSVTIDKQEGTTEELTVPADIINAVGHDFISLEDGTEQQEDAINGLSALGGNGTLNDCFININVPEGDKTFDFSKQIIKGEVINNIFQNDEEEYIAITFWSGDIDVLTWQFNRNFIIADDDTINLGMIMTTNDDGTNLDFYESKIFQKGIGVVVNTLNPDCKYTYFMPKDDGEPEYMGNCKADETTGKYGIKLNDFSGDYYLSTKVLQEPSVSDNVITEESEVIEVKSNNTYKIVVGGVGIVLIGIVVFVFNKKRKK